jgi:hypothetical protein
MPVEIRELIIKTEIVVGKKNDSNAAAQVNLAAIKRQLLAECKRMLAEDNKRRTNKR